MKLDKWEKDILASIKPKYKQWYEIFLGNFYRGC
jgi:hypothetical protein